MADDRLRRFEVRDADDVGLPPVQTLTMETLAELVAEEQVTPDEYTNIVAMEVGQHILLGGGAEPVWEVRRVADAVADKAGIVAGVPERNLDVERVLPENRMFDVKVIEPVSPGLRVPGWILRDLGSLCDQDRQAIFALTMGASCVCGDLSGTYRVTRV